MGGYIAGMNASAAQSDDDLYPRLPPTDTTVKELFAKSGNRCSFPGCLVPVVDDLGTVIGQIVHIKGVKPTSPRFDVTQTPEDRRHPSNLLIMCNPHHKVTDDEALYPVDRMRGIKEAHEGRFGGVVAGLQGTLEDQTKHAVVHPPESMLQYSVVFGLTQEEANDTMPQFVTLLNHLAKLPPDARSVLATIVDRGIEGGLASWTMEGALEVPLPELRAVLGVTDNQLRDELVILKNHGLADVDLDGTEESLGAAVVLAIPRIKGVDSYVLRDLKAVSEATGISVARPIVGLDFRLLDNG
jgi:hypothetical protein